jgi:hypothetical protein
MIRQNHLIRRTVTMLALLAGSLGAATAWTQDTHPTGVLPKGQPAEFDLTNDPTHRYGEPQIAANPTNPNNILYFVMSNMLTYKCEIAGDANCIKFTHGTPDGQYKVSGWISTHLFVTFDGGRRWSEVKFPAIPKARGFAGEAADHSDLVSRGDPMVTVTADGTFYIGWDAMNLGFQNIPPYGTIGSLIDGGIAVSKSTDGGRTWSTPVLTGTGVDRPWMITDLSTGRVYEASSGFLNGSMSTGNAALPITSSARDRWVVSSQDGVQWTAPEQLGSGTFSAAASNISAAHGVLAAGLHSTEEKSCQFFASIPAPCTVFETSTDSGAHWTRHAVPGLASASGSVLVAANPTTRNTYTIAASDSTGMKMLVYVTHDSGATWKGPTVVTDNPDTKKFKTWINYSPEGVLGLAWRSVLPGPPTTTSNANPAAEAAAGRPLGRYTVWAAISHDSGATFSQPLRISSAASPAPDPNMTGGTDDLSFLAVSKREVLVGWGDWRPGDLAGYFASVKLQAFRQ